MPSAAVGMEEMRMAAGIIFVFLIVIGVFGIKSYAKWLARRGCGSGGSFRHGLQARACIFLLIHPMIACAFLILSDQIS